MNSFTKEETFAWWAGVVNDPVKMQAWLQKLRRTELEGYTEHCTFLGKAGLIDERTAKILMNIALDELKHAGIIDGLLQERGFPLGEPPKSAYWESMNANVVTLEEYCAVNYFGEDLAASRFHLIQAHPQTPTDIKEALRIILPDEVFHRSTLKHLAGEEVIERMRPHHDKAVALLRVKA